MFYRSIALGGPARESWTRPALVAMAALYVILSLPIISASILPPNGPSNQATLGTPPNTTEMTPSVKNAEVHDRAPKNGSNPMDAAEANRIALRYQKGLDGPANITEAIKWYTKAADQGDTEAQYNLGDIYESGDGIPKAMLPAIAWYTKAAAGGDSRAQDRLGRIYDRGLGVSKDPAEAIKWYTKAAEQGEVLDQFRLGEMYSEGTDVPKDVVAATLWYQKAAAQGFGAASIRLSKIQAKGTRVSLTSK